jgi:hypothetical protein
MNGNPQQPIGDATGTGRAGSGRRLLSARARRAGARLVLLAAVSAAACESTGPEAPPAAPATLAAVPSSDRRITLTWAFDDDDDVTAVRIERAQGSGGFAETTTLGGAATSHIDTGLAPGTTYRYRVRACNDTGCSEFGPEASATTFGTLVITTASLPAGVFGARYEVTIAATGGNGQLTYALGGGELPPGLTLAPSGSLSGTPAAAGTFQFIVRVTSGDGQSADRELVLRVRGLLEIMTNAMPNAVVSRTYNAAISAVGGDSVYTWFVEAGSLPAGLTLSDRGLVSGTPDSEQTARFTARVRSGDGQTAVKELSITVSASAPTATVTIRTTLLPPGIQGLRYDPLLRARVSNSSPVTWSLVSGGLPPGLTLAPNGGISGHPSQIGSFTFTVRATAGGSSADATLTIRIDRNDTSRFNITRFDVAPVASSIAPHVTQAIARWEGVVVGEMEIDSIPRGFFGSNACSGFGDEANGTAIEDVIVMVNISPIDGEGGVLAQAGPCAFREDNNLTGIGVLTLDQSDLARLTGTQTLTDVIFHEIGHVLGFGTLWDGFGCTPGTPLCRNYLEGESGDDPTFTGPSAVREWRALGGSGDVPIENTGGSGTRLSHWREETFDSEVMTGFVESVGTRNPLSRMTIASFADLGYTVSYATAEPYLLPRAAPALVAPEGEERAWEEPLGDRPVPLGPRP